MNERIAAFGPHSKPANCDIFRADCFRNVDWHDIVDEPTFTDAIFDRLVHNAHRLALDGPSMRKTDAAPAAETVDESDVA